MRGQPYLKCNSLFSQSSLLQPLLVRPLVAWPGAAAGGMYGGWRGAGVGLLGGAIVGGVTGELTGQRGNYYQNGGSCRNWEESSCRSYYHDDYKTFCSTNNIPYHDNAYCQNWDDHSVIFKNIQLTLVPIVVGLSVQRR